MAKPVLVTAPASEPISLATARQHCRVDPDFTDDDDLITAMIVAARQMAEQELDRKLITQTWETVLDAFPGDDESIRLQVWKPRAISQITYVDSAGDTQTMSALTYALDADTAPGYVFPAQGTAWPTDVIDGANVVRVRYTVGYGLSETDVPATVRSWMLLQIGALYRNREAFVQGAPIVQIPNAFVGALLDPERQYL